MSCHTDTDECGCLYPSNTDCVWYKSDAELSCLGITSGATLTEILQAVDTVICNGIPAVSGHVYVVHPVNGETTVSTNTVGGTTTYTVGLSDTITDTLSDLQNQINAVATCCTDSVHDITTTTPGYLDISQSGTTWNIDFLGSIPATYQGIIENNTTFINTSNTPGDQVLQSFNYNYIAGSDISDKDEIRFTATGKISATSSLYDYIKVELYDATGATTLWADTVGGFNSSGVSSWFLNGCISVTSVASGTALYTLNFNSNTVANGVFDTYARNSGANINADISGIDFANLTIRIKYVHNTAVSGNPNNGVRQLKVEVVKYLS